MKDNRVTYDLLSTTVSTALLAAQEAAKWAGTTFQKAVPGESRLPTLFAGVALLGAAKVIEAYTAIARRSGDST